MRYPGRPPLVWAGVVRASKRPGWGRGQHRGTFCVSCFFTVMMVLGLVTPGYDWVSRIGSELSLGSLGWIMIANFIALGVVALALAAALGGMIGDRPSGWVAAAAVGLLGAAFVVAGVCVTDPSRLVSGAHTWHGVVHALMATVIFFVATPIAALAIARRLRRQHRFARYSVLTAVGTPRHCCWPPSAARACSAWASGSPSPSSWPG